VDHAGALGHTGQAVGVAGGGGQSEGARDKLRECVGGADGTRSGQPGIVRRVEVGVCRRNAVEDLADG